MIFPLGILIFFSSASAAAIAPSPAPISQSPTNVTFGPKTKPECVNTGKFSAWNGRVIVADCEKVLASFKDKTARYTNQMFAFYSSRDGFKPPPGPKGFVWKLPASVVYRKYQCQAVFLCADEGTETCKIQIQMIRDFSIAEIPADDMFLLPSRYPPAAISTWHSILEEAEKILLCARYGQPGWISDGVPIKTGNTAYPIGIFMWGRSSAISEKYPAAGPGGSSQDNAAMNQAWRQKFNLVQG